MLHLVDTSLTFFGANNTGSSAPQLRFSTLVTKTERYCCWTDWVFFWEDHAFSYKHGCLFPSTFSLFFYRLVIDEALVFFHISLTTRPIFLWPLCVALLQNWGFLPWLLRQSDLGAGLIGSSPEKTMRSATNMVVYSLQHSHCFFYRLVIDETLVSRLVLHLLDNSSHFSWAIVCSAAPQLRFSTLITKKAILLLDWLGLLLRRPCVQLQLF